MRSGCQRGAPLFGALWHDRRIAAALDALVLAEHRMHGALLRAIAEAPDTGIGFATGAVLALQTREPSDPSAALALELWRTGPDALREGMRHALAGLSPQDRAPYATATDHDHLGACAAWLRARDGTPPDAPAPEAWVDDAAQPACALAWWTLAMTLPAGPDAAGLGQLAHGQRLAAAIVGPPPLAHAASAAACVWCPAWLLPWARAELSAATPSAPVVAWLLAVLGEPTDLPLLVARRATLGDVHYTELLARTGWKGAAEQLAGIVAGEDGLSAALAGRALGRITGVQATTEARFTLPAHNDDFAEDVRAVDAAQALAARQRLAPALAPGARVRAGLDLSRFESPAEWPEACDMEARQDARWRRARRCEAPAHELEWPPLTAALLRLSGAPL